MKVLESTSLRKTNFWYFWNSWCFSSDATILGNPRFHSGGRGKSDQSGIYLPSISKPQISGNSDKLGFPIRPRKARSFWNYRLKFSSLLKHAIFFHFGPEPSSSDFPWSMSKLTTFLSLKSKVCSIIYYMQLIFVLTSSLQSTHFNWADQCFSTWIL